MIRPAVMIEHHPSRAALLPALLTSLAPLPVEVVTDPDPDSPVPGSWRTYRACLERFPAEATHALILQDDTVVWPGLPQELASIIEAAPGDDPLIALWLGGGPWATAKMQGALDRGESFLPLRRPHTAAVALVWPRRRRDEILAEAPPPSDSHVGDQDVIERWRRRVPLVATVPSLVDHPGAVPSIRHPNKQASAARMTGVCVGDVDVLKSWRAVPSPPPRRTGAVSVDGPTS